MGDVVSTALAAAAGATLVAALGVAAARDVASRVVPNGCSLAVLASGLVRAAAEVPAEGPAPLAAALVGPLAPLALLLAVAWLPGRGRGGIGGGDVKLLSAVGAWVGPAWGLVCVGASCVLGLAGWVVRALLARLRRRPPPPRTIALAPAIALAALCVVCVTAWG